MHIKIKQASLDTLLINLKKGIFSSSANLCSLEKPLQNLGFKVLNATTKEFFLKKR